MDTGSYYLVFSHPNIDGLVKPEMREEYLKDKNWIATDKYTERTPGLFKPEFVGTRGMFLTSKCYLVQTKMRNVLARKTAGKGS